MRNFFKRERTCTAIIVIWPLILHYKVQCRIANNFVIVLDKSSRPNTVFRNINQDRAPQQMYMLERKRIKREYLRKQCVPRVRHKSFRCFSNYKYDYRRYRIVAHIMPEGRVTLSFLTIILPFSSRAKQNTAQKVPTEGFHTG